MAGVLDGRKVRIGGVRKRKGRAGGRERRDAGMNENRGGRSQRQNAKC